MATRLYVTKMVIRFQVVPRRRGIILRDLKARLKESSFFLFFLVLLIIIGNSQASLEFAEKEL